ncbi:hypothetical protein [Gemmiger sp. An50]|uniref:hypothetical protein n=1 Tax=Gemmiger sp. An50 TaxID=1965639 RepID=UPI000B38C5D6|nr:hypothetical protein [Gemmiger sp. An50]OUN87591.1 hypothetical protein B5G03_02070 [Gemmiger sp. An50]
MNKNRRIRIAFSCAVALLLGLACMALPSAFCTLQQARLLQTTHARPAEENALSGQGRENGLAKLLYDRQFLAGTTPEWDSTGWQPLEQTEEEQAQTIRAVVEQLQSEGLLSDTLAATAYALLEGEKADIRKNALQDAAGFMRYEWSKEADSLLLELGPGGEVVRFQWSGASGQARAAELLERYKRFLQVTEFSDWQDLSGEDGHLAAAYSPAAQLYVYALDRGGVALGAEHKTTEQVATATNEKEGAE